MIGHNGAGKSTLLKTIAGVPIRRRLAPAAVEGKVCSLFDITLGFEQEATGLGEHPVPRRTSRVRRPRRIRGKLDEIAAFSELGDFLNIPVRNYSARNADEAGVLHRDRRRTRRCS